MSAKISRRDWLRRSSVAGAAVTAGSAAAAEPVGRPGWQGSSRVRQIATDCEMCFWRCGVLADVRDGKVVKLQGNPDHPLTQGRLCARGNAGTQLLYDPDRLKRPMLRIGARGEGKFQEISWDQALDFLATRLNGLKRKYGAESVALFPHGVGATFFGTVMKAFGTPNSAEPAFSQCRGPREVGYALTFGNGLGSPEPVDLEESKLIVLIGSHIGENVFTSQVTAFSTALGRGAKLIVVDPRFSVAASKADWWLPIRPGTDIALLLAWMNVLLTEGTYDQEYISSYAQGLPELAAHVGEFTPEWAEGITELPARQIRETARAMAAARPAVALHPGRHATWYGDDTQRSRAMAIVTALLGSWGRKGGIFLPTAIAAGKSATPPFPKPARERADGAGTLYPLASEEQGLTLGLVRATLSAKPYPIKGWVVYGQNVLESIPQRQQTLKAIGQLDLMVVVDVLPVEQINYADLVLPEATYLERYDPPAVVTSAKRPFVAVREPVCEPLYDSRPGWWIARETARRLGLEAWFPWQTPDEHLDTIIRPLGINARQLRTRGAVSFDGRPYLEDRQPGDGPLFPTGSGKIELYSPALKQLGFDPLPRYTPVSDPPSMYFRLLYGRSPVHSFARSENNAWLDALMPENQVWINKDAARDLRLGEGERVVLENQDGVKSDPVLVRVTSGIRRDCVYMVHGFGSHSRALRRAYRRGASDTALITRIGIDPIMGGTGMRVNFVRVRKAEGAGWEGAGMARYAMAIDLGKCVGCQACTVACNSEWEVPAGYARTRVRFAGPEGVFPKLLASPYVAQCNHCDRPACVRACPTGATYQAENGIIGVDRNLCIGCGFCVEACPYDARFLNPVNQKVDKCDFCSSRVEKGLEPACVATCTAHAKFFGDLEDSHSEVFRLVYEQGARRNETAAASPGPNVYYIGRKKNVNLALATFAPRPPRLLTQGRVWKGFVKPLVLGAITATFLGQAVAFFVQLMKGEDQFDD